MAKKPKEKAAPLNITNVLVVSLGCGSEKKVPVYSAESVNQFSMMQWIIQPLNGRTPMTEMLSEASADMVDYNTSVLFESHGVENNYLRIQVYML